MRRSGQSFPLKSQAALPLLLAGLLFAAIGGMGLSARAQEEPPGDVEQPADVAPDGAEIAPEEELIEPGDPEHDLLKPKTLDRSFMRPDLKGDGEGPPPQSTEESKQDKLGPLPDDMPLPTPLEKPKMLAELYAQLGKARDAEAAVPIVESIEALWRFSGSDTVDLLMHRAERLAKDEDFDLSLKILDATADLAPDQAEVWHLMATVHYLKKDYGQAIADLKRALDRDPKHFGALNDLGVALEAVGAKKEALEAYRQALTVNPFLPESTKRAVDELGREVEGQPL
jgi:tetratricopeptide (TPR) repeat protein